MNIRELLQSTTVLLAAIGGYAIVLLRDVLLPPRFLADGILIRAIAQGATTGDFSYTNTANVYAFLGLADAPGVAYVLGYTLAVTAVAIVWFRCRTLVGGWGITALLVIALALSAVYLGYYSKDVILLPITISVLALPARTGSILVLLAMMLGYAYFFRNYWLIVAALFWAYWILMPRLSTLKLLAAAVLGVVATSAVMIVVLGMPADQFRSNINEFREDVGTIIQPFVSLPEPFGGVVNNAITFVALLIPIPVALNGGLYYVAIALAIATIWLLFFYAIRNESTRSLPRIRIAAALTISFVVTQALFEPDYGSALRHLTPLLPLFIYIVWIAADERSRRRRRPAPATGLKLPSEGKSPRPLSA